MQKTNYLFILFQTMLARSVKPIGYLNDTTWDQTDEELSTLSIGNQTFIGEFSVLAEEQSANYSICDSCSFTGFTTETIAYPGHDIGPGFPVADFDDCIESCKNTERCVSLSYSEISYCFPKYASLEVEYRPNVMSARKCLLVAECDATINTTTTSRSKNGTTTATTTSTTTTGTTTTSKPKIVYEAFSNKGCFYKCGNKPGSCDNFCQNGGFCCSITADYSNEGCTTEMVDTLRDSSITANEKGYRCVKPKQAVNYKTDGTAGCLKECRNGGYCPDMCRGNGFCCEKKYDSKRNRDCTPAMIDALFDLTSINYHRCVYNVGELIRTTGYSGFDPMDFIEWFDETEDEKDESILDILHDFAGHVSSVINSSLDAANTVVNGVLFTFTSFQLGWF